MINENTGEDPKCPICNASEFWECGHLIADIDVTFCEMHSGILKSRARAFQDIMERRLTLELEGAQAIDFSDEQLDQHWRDAVELNIGNEDFPIISGGFFYSWLIIRLEDAGAIDADGPVIDEGGPGFSSELRLLFSDDPEELVEAVLQKAREEFG
ncbi:UNVERIFIED_CONTAM: hypothetical protein K0B97_03125 [Spiribacter pallidus]|jgi:hypothetical protein